MVKGLFAFAAFAASLVSAAVIAERGSPPKNPNPDAPVALCQNSKGWLTSWGGQNADYDGSATFFCESQFPGSNLIHTINAYSGKGTSWTIVTLEIIYNDGTSVLHGDHAGPSYGTKSTITFGPGELVRSAFIADNGVSDKSKNRLGAIHFETDTQSVTIGPSKSSTVTTVNVGSGLLVGIAGSQGGEIGRATLLFLGSKIQSITTGEPKWLPGYDPTTAKPNTGKPNVFTTHYWNSLSVPATFSDATASSYTTSTTWDESISTTFGVKFGTEVSGGILGLADVKESTEISWSLSFSASNGGATQNMTMHTTTMGTTSMPPNSGADCTSTTYHASGDFKYTTLVTILMVDGTKYNWNEPGSMSTDAFTDTQMVCAGTNSSSVPTGATSGSVVPVSH